jgi:hypothetical protein
MTYCREPWAQWQTQDQNNMAISVNFEQQFLSPHTIVR